MTFLESIKTCFRKYADFKGRATRSEFWWFQLFAIGLMFCAEALDVLILGHSSDSLITPIAITLDALMILPIAAVVARRFHDIGWSGWWQLPLFGFYALYLEAFFPNIIESWLILGPVIFVGFYSLWYLAMMIRDSQPLTNKYGPNPKSEGVSEVFS